MQTKQVYVLRYLTQILILPYPLFCTNTVTHYTEQILKAFPMQRPQAPIYHLSITASILKLEAEHLLGYYL